MLRHPILGLIVLVVACLPAHAAEPKWLRVDSSHFSVLTDADETSGREVAARFEQMREIFAQLLMKSRLNLSEPIDIIALKSDEAFSKACPSRADANIARGGFFLPGDDRVYFVLNLSKPDSWRAISYDFARVLLKYNYPPTQAWFDEGFAEYFSSLQMDNFKAQLGGDPAAPSTGSRNSFVELLSATTWLTIPALFNTHDVATASGSERHTLFHAESWIVMHYLFTQNKLSETGAYFGLVQIDKLPVEEAIQKAYGMSAAQMEQAVKNYFRGFSAAPATSPKTPSAAALPATIQSVNPVAADSVGVSPHEILGVQARAALSEMGLRIAEHREQTRRQLEGVVADSRTDTAIAHRALGWDHLDKKDLDSASEEFQKALELDSMDPWTHYYLALGKYWGFQATQQVKGLPNMMEDLHIVLDWKPEFAEAYFMLAWAQRQGGGIHAATDSIRAAVQLNPRNEAYLLEMARIYMAGKNWDAATALLERLTASPDSQLATAAKGHLHDLPTLKKYGLLPQAEASPTDTKSPPSTASASHPPSSKPATSPQAAEGDDEGSDEPPAEPQIDKRPIQYLKAKLISVDCSQAPSALLTVSSGAKTLRLRAADYKSITLVGEGQFSCDWKDRAISVNYKAGGKADGDLVSLEIR